MNYTGREVDDLLALHKAAEHDDAMVRYTLIATTSGLPCK